MRQLENIVERAVIFTKGEVILPDALSDPLTPRVKEEAGMPIVSPVFSKSRERMLDEFEERFVRHALSKNHGNVTEAAKESKMTRQNFQRLMKKHGIRSDQFR